MSSQIRWNGVLALSLVATMCATAHAAEDGQFAAAIQPILARNCQVCHGAKKQAARIVLHKLSGKFEEDGLTIWQTIREQLESGAMPPDDAQPLEPADKQALLGWIQAELSRADKALEQVAPIFPGQGNLVDHQALFSPENRSLPGELPRLWRLSASAYASEVERLAGRTFADPAGPTGRRMILAGWPSFTAPWSDGIDEGFQDYAALQRIDEPEVDLLLFNAKAASFYLLGKHLKKNVRSGVPTNRFKFLAAAPAAPSESEAAAAVREAFEIILRRSPTAAEQARYQKFLLSSCGEFGNERGVSQMLAAALIHPESVYRVELGGVSADAHGRVPLTAHERSFALAYALTDRGPDADLQAAARSGKLSQPEGWNAQVERMLQLPVDQLPKLARFFREYFDYPKAADVFKDADTRRKDDLPGARYNPDIFVRDTDALVRHVLQADRNVLAELLTTDHVVLTEKQGAFYLRPHWWASYNTAEESATQPMPLELPPSERCGILTQPSWLIAHSTSFENQAIQRGRWVRERLLGGSLPSTPITVEAQLPDEPTLTLRERMHVTRESFCWKCHEQMDPLGLPFEQFDHYGRYRLTELGKPADATGAITRTGDASLDGPVKSPRELLEKLARSELVEQVFVRHAFRFWLGRNETLRDGPTLQAAQRGYRESGGSMKALVASLLKSDSFLYRRVPGAAENSAAR